MSELTEAQFDECRKLAGEMGLQLGTVPTAQQLMVLAMVAGGIVAVKAPNTREMKRGLAAFSNLAETQAKGMRKNLDTLRVGLQ
ncbi:hypothetical protein [Rhodoplanes sp. Z2-YC6860]|uniref:hypothetical protein n=1 Tax=Rhodoplanes sp. Z2-YC6860 TaxID=674703 RepID=UPI00082F4E3F|nr:hypothetical protein [Rhodoplanes sp. Z2-YC6860]